MSCSDMTVIQLRAKLGELGLSKQGNKADLVARLEEQHRQLGPQAVTSKEAMVSPDDIILNMSSIRLTSSDTPWEKMTVPELKAEASKYGLKVSGKRLRDDYLTLLRSYFNTDMNYRPDFSYIGNRNLRVLMIAEKPSMAREISNALVNRRFIREYKVSGKLSVSEFQSSIFGYTADFRVSSTFGHIFGDDFHKDVPRNADEALFDASIVQVQCDTNFDLPHALADLADGYDALVLWLDCDLEGEAICYEVLDSVRNALNKPPSGNIMDVVFRARFSAAEDAPDAINRLQKPDFRQCLAARAKHDLDLRVGVAMSRYQTFCLRRNLRGYDIPHISYGPCQIPCLTFCVKALEAVEQHVESYNYHIIVKLDVNGAIVEAKSKLFKDKVEANECLKRIQKAQKAQVVDVERKSHVKQAPTALNTVALLKLCSTQLGMGPKDAMQCAERLYTSGLISYPRTETTRYPKELRLRERHKGIQRNIPIITDDIEYMDWEAAENSQRDGVDAGDHQPIMPTGKSDQRLSLGPKEMRVYEVICRHFLASLMPAERYHSDTVVFAAEGVEICRTVHGIDDIGFGKVISWQRAHINPSNDFNITPMKGQTVSISSVRMTETVVSSPSLLNESELIGLMEKHRIGTDASIPGHIDNIIKRNYVVVHPETRRLTPTVLGRTLINVYRKCVPRLAEPEMRAQMEQQLMKIATGEHDFEDVRIHVRNTLKAQFHLFKESFHTYSRSFESCFKKDPNFVDRGPSSSNHGRRNHMGSSNNAYSNPIITSAPERPVYVSPQPPVQPVVRKSRFAPQSPPSRVAIIQTPSTSAPSNAPWHRNAPRPVAKRYQLPPPPPPPPAMTRKRLAKKHPVQSAPYYSVSDDDNDSDYQPNSAKRKR